ncbi:30S ribosomal protein S8 [Candidatus Saccharibacteria bacterium]|nr:30S ribosomal protein S8 [Candidatus Saccharibacteria bacterium]
MTDPIADMLSRIKNAIAVNKAVVSLPHSKTKEKVAQILLRNGFLKDVKSSKKNSLNALVITINDEDASANITEISRLSRPGRRQYVTAKDIPRVRRGRGLVVISTSAGIMTGEEARVKKLGGELICEVY